MPTRHATDEIPEAFERPCKANQEREVVHRRLAFQRRSGSVVHDRVREISLELKSVHAPATALGEPSRAVAT